MSDDDPKRYELPGVGSVWDVETAWAKRDGSLVDPYVYAACTDAIEYVIRHPRKGGIEDLKKARDCLNAAIEYMEPPSDDIRDYLDPVYESVSSKDLGNGTYELTFHRRHQPRNHLDTEEMVEFINRYKKDNGGRIGKGYRKSWDDALDALIRETGNRNYADAHSLKQSYKQACLRYAKKAAELDGDGEASDEIESEDD